MIGLAPPGRIRPWRLTAVVTALRAAFPGAKVHIDHYDPRASSARFIVREAITITDVRELLSMTTSWAPRRLRIVLGLVIVTPYLLGILHMFVGEPRPPDNLSWAPVFLGVALIGIGAIVLAVRPSAKRDEEEDADRVACSFCAEHIKSEAILCPHCGSIVATPTGRLARREGPIKSEAKALLDSLFFRIEEARSIGPSSRDAAQKILEWLDGMDPDRGPRRLLR
jgi:hypothetical protein